MNWKQRLEDAATNKYDICKTAPMRQDANNWYCCAIGEKLNIPQSTRRDPQQAHVALGDAIYATFRELFDLGHRFGDAVSNKRYEDASAIYDHINEILTPEVCEHITKNYIARRREARRYGIRGRPWRMKEGMEIIL